VGEKVEFPSNGKTAEGYLATPASGAGPGVIVIQEWWGLVPHIIDVADRFAAEGFAALAPDLYHGAAATEPDEAGKLMMGLDLERAAKDLTGAVDYLLSRGSAVGCVGYCMGGGLALWLASLRPEIAEAVVYYGVIPWPQAQPNLAAIAGHVTGFFGENDTSASPEHVKSLEADLNAAGVSNDMTIYPGADHAFFNDTRPEVYRADLAAQTWARTIAALRDRL